MQGTVVMLLALSGLGCHHKKVETSYVESCYSSCYSSGCYSSCYSGTSCYSSCYSGAAYSPADYSCYSCYSSCYSSPRHKHGLFGCKRKTCAVCCAPPPSAPVCDPCATGYSGPPVYGTYTPVYDAYSSGQYIGTGQTPMTAPSMPAPKPADTAAPSAPEAPSPGNPAPPATPPPAAPAPAAPAPTPPPGA